MQIHYGNDKKSVLFFGVKHPIRESPNQRPPDVAIKNRPRTWIGYSALNRRVDFNRENISKGRFDILVVFDSLIQLALGFRMKAKAH